MYIRGKTTQVVVIIKWYENHHHGNPFALIWITGNGDCNRYKKPVLLHLHRFFDEGQYDHKTV